MNIISNKIPIGRYLKKLILQNVAQQQKIINVNVMIIHLFSMHADDNEQHFSQRWPNLSYAFGSAFILKLVHFNIYLKILPLGFKVINLKNYIQKIVNINLIFHFFKHHCHGRILDQQLILLQKKVEPHVQPCPFYSPVCFACVHVNVHVKIIP